jgi:hypothetical protein
LSCCQSALTKHHHHYHHRINWNTRVESYSGPYQGKQDIEDKGLEGEEVIFFVLMSFWMVYMETYGNDFFTRLFVIYIKHHHHQEGGEEEEEEGQDSLQQMQMYAAMVTREGKSFTCISIYIYINLYVYINVYMYIYIWL